MKFREAKRAISRFFINVATSGKYPAKEKEAGVSDYLARYVLMNLIFITGFLTLMIFTIWDYVIGTPGARIDAHICLVMALISVAAFILGRSKLPQMAVAMLLMVSYGLMCAALVWNNSTQGVNFVFVYIYPPLTIMMLGMVPGIIISLSLLALVLVEVFIPGIADYPLEVAVRYVTAYFMIFYIIVVIESTRIVKNRLIEDQTRRLEDLRHEAETANRAKSDFLASMSHEIRTPMNAIVGMAELLLRGNLNGDERSYANDIKQAGNNLISIINDILDFSKIESGKMEIIPVQYLLPSLVNDTVNIIRMRLMEKPVRFYTNIQADLPNGLTGDETRMRQIILNLLSNAAKYTVKGYISMTITADKRDEETVWLRIAIRDTGLGIKPEDQKKLFGNFVQVDTRKNRSIEGTGLGLAITRRLCQAMGGDITVESEYGKGSVFTVSIPQGVYSPETFAAVDDPEKKPVLVYEGRKVYADSVCWSLNQMKIPHTLVTDEASFAEAVDREEWYFVFSGYGLYERIKSLWERPAASFPAGKKPSLALMVEWGTEAYIPGVRFVSLPVQSLGIANVLSGKPDRGYIDSGGLTGTRFVIPGARLLLVDDIATNLKVAEGLLSPYKAVIDICLSGAEAIELVKRNVYDIIFMDHMMPDMDGIETTGHIRELEGDYFKTVPVIALTANAVSGMKEMFLEKGFNDFLAKPIDVSKLDETLAHWIPKAKQKKEDAPREESGGTGAADSLIIPGVDVQRGISMTGGKPAGYKQVLALFREDAEERLALLRQVPAADALPVFVTQVHALKSAAASIGAAEVSAAAARLEAAGKAGNMALIEQTLPEFAEQLAALIEGIGAAMANEKEEKKKRNLEFGTATGESSGLLPASDNKIPNSTLRISNLLKDLAASLETQKADDIDRRLEELLRQNVDLKTKETLEHISDDVLMAEYGKALENVKNLIHREKTG